MVWEYNSVSNGILFFLSILSALHHIIIIGHFAAYAIEVLSLSPAYPINEHQRGFNHW